MLKFEVHPPRFLHGVLGTTQASSSGNSESFSAAESDRDFAKLNRHRRFEVGRERWESEIALYGFRGVK